ncbi:MAG: PfkB domain protein [Acidimicrobiaceae bacterium]|nr:PfkB domain protein [Acidimicrobiaceae bacterium]
MGKGRAAMILVCGEALVDLVQVGVGQGAPLFRALPGGSPANAAVALARLGQAVGLVSRLGDDDAGTLVRQHLVRNGVDPVHLIRASEPTSLALVTLGDTGDASYAFYFEATAGWLWRSDELPSGLGPEVEAVHLGSMALATPYGRAVLAEFVERERDRRCISLDPNVRIGVVPDVDSYRSDLEELVTRCHLVRVSEEDLETLYPGEPTEDVAERWSASGPRLLVVSRGELGPLTYFHGTVSVGPTRKVEVVDTVGAGDTFSAALLDSLARAGLLAGGLSGLDSAMLDTALEYAVTAASITCQRQGADPPSAAEVAAALG